MCDSLWSSDHLLESFFKKIYLADGSTTLCSLDFAPIIRSFCHQHFDFDFHPRRLFSDLWQSAKCLDVTQPSRLLAQKSALANLPTTPQRHLGPAEFAHITRIILAALCASAPAPNNGSWLAARRLRRFGHIAISASLYETSISAKSIESTMNLMESLNDDMALSLLRRLTRAISGYCQVFGFLSTPVLEAGIQEHSWSIDALNLIVRSIWEPNVILVRPKSASEPLTLKGGSLIESTAFHTTTYSPEDLGFGGTLNLVVEWLYGILLGDWDGEAIIPRPSAVGGALRLLLGLCKPVNLNLKKLKVN